MDRSCDGCTKCCEGHLVANIYGYEMRPGKPCHFITKSGCSIYASRPANPCQKFKCAWKSNPKIPDELKPTITGTILLNKYLNGTHYIQITSAGQDVSLDIIDWAIRAVNAGDVSNVVYQINGQIRIISHDPEFVSNFNQRKSK
jgi:hypothetical protein